MSKPRVRLNTPLQKHSQGLCGCSFTVNPNFCVYQPFLDGWDFTSDVGNGGKRGEIFTPRFIVDKMIVDSGMLPEAAVYDYDYTTLSKADALKVVRAKINEPAIGTGNFSSTILWHKVHYVDFVSRNKTGRLDLKKYNLHLLEAIASMYSNDIDVGNLEASKWRFLRLGGIYTEKNVEFWVDHILNTLDVELNFENLLLENETYSMKVLGEFFTSMAVVADAKTNEASTVVEETDTEPVSESSAPEALKTHLEQLSEEETKVAQTTVQALLKADIETQVRASLTAADENWAAADEDRGIIDVLYKKHTGQNPTLATRELWKHILDENMKLFNGIIEDDTIDVENNFIVPGWFNINWTWWGFSNWAAPKTGQEGEISVDIQETRVPLAKQILEGKLANLKQEILTLEEKRVPEAEGTTTKALDIKTEPKLVFADDKDKKTYTEKQRQVRVTEKKIKQIETGKLEIEYAPMEALTMEADQGSLF